MPAARTSSACSCRLNMLIEFGDAFDYSGGGFPGWCSEVGFRRFEVMHLAGPSSAAMAYK